MKERYLHQMAQQVVKQKWYQKIRIVEAQTELGQMYYLIDEELNFIPYVKEYLNMIQARAEREVAPNTIRTYCYLLWYFIVFLTIRGWNVLDLDGQPDRLIEFKLWLNNPYRFYENITVLNDGDKFEYEADTLKAKTMNAILSQVSSLYLWLKASHRIKENPVIYRNVMVTSSMRDKDMLAHTRRSQTTQVNILKSKVPKVIPKTINNKNFKRYLDDVNLLRDKIILLCLKEGGFRSNELLGIRLEDIDFAEQGIWVRFRTDNSNKARAKAGYGRDRFVHLPSDLMILIDRYISSEWVNSNPTEDFLFIVVGSHVPTDIGSAMTKSTLDSIFKYRSKKTGIKLHPHMLRHTHATELAREYISKGEPINWEYISKRLGHASVTTTMEIYAHLTPEDYKKEYDRMTKYRETKRKKE